MKNRLQIILMAFAAASLFFVSCGSRTELSSVSESSESSQRVKKISFLGDSISTYAGWSNNMEANATIGGNAVWFPNTNYAGADMDVEKTWWYLSATELEYSICVNNSWSGSVIKDVSTYDIRARNLYHESEGDPDIVVIFMGVNDFALGTPVGDYDGTGPAVDYPSDFSEAYGRTVSVILDCYGDAEVYCCTFLPDRKRFSESVNGKRIDEEEYNQAIRTISENLGVKLIDLYRDSGITSSNIAEYTVDRLHPNEAGMALIAKTVAETIRASEK